MFSISRPLGVTPPATEAFAAVPEVASIAAKLHTALEARAALIDRANARLADAGPAEAVYREAVTNAVRAGEPTDTIKNEAPAIVGESRELARLANEEAQRVEMFGYDLRDAITENFDALAAALDPGVEQAAADYRRAIDAVRAARQRFAAELGVRAWLGHAAELGAVPPLEVLAEGGGAERYDRLEGLVPIDADAALEALMIDATGLDQQRARERRERKFRAEDQRWIKKAAESGYHREPERIPALLHRNDHAVHDVRAITESITGTE
jgi:hypothetical protein